MAVEKRKIVIIGAGLSGIGMAHQLLAKGESDFVILERASEVGGTWRDNRYPGCECDVPSHLYSLSFAQKTDWSRTYASQPEIQSYILALASRSGLREYVRFQSQVVSLVFDDQCSLWTVFLEGGSEIKCQFVVAATGALSKPQLPAISGQKKFRGTLVHSADWPENLDLTDKRVVVIGTGASAIQIVPTIANQVRSLHVVQRSPAWVLKRFNTEISQADQTVYARFAWRLWLRRFDIFIRNELRTLAAVHFPSLVSIYEKRVRRRLQSELENADLIAKLTPRYRLGCKRALRSNDYFTTFLSPNVELVTDEIIGFTPGGLKTASENIISADIVIAATGFAAGRPLSGIQIAGLGGRDLQQDWASGAEAYLGAAIEGYPNFFMLGGPNSGSGTTSVLLMIESQIAMITRLVTIARRRGANRITLSAGIQRKYNEKIAKRLGSSVWGTGCRSWYQAADGKNVHIFPGLSMSFRRMCKASTKRSFGFSHFDDRDHHSNRTPNRASRKHLNDYVDRKAK